MPETQGQKLPARRHRMALEGRERLSVEGVEDVSGFDESLVALRTPLGELNIRGEGLHIERIDLEQGQLELRGKIVELGYDGPPEARSLWSRLFG